MAAAIRSVFLQREEKPGVEPLFPFSTVHYEAMITEVWNPCAPLLLCTVGSDHPGVEPLCLFSNVHCGGNDHPGVEPLCPFTTVHCRQ